VQVKVLFIGDIFGKPGRNLVSSHLPTIRGKYDFVIANAENAAGGFGLNKDSFSSIVKAGVDCVTLGNHAWDNREVLSLIDDPRIVRPKNYPSGAPGRGAASFDMNNERITVTNFLGRIFMNPLDDPFASLEEILEQDNLGAVFVDFHAEATSEKACFAWHFDGRIAALIGTHTHVPTADTRFLTAGTAFQTDSGMTGPQDSSIGMGLDAAIYKFRTGLPQKNEVAQGKSIFNAVEFDLSGNVVTRMARYSFLEGSDTGKLEGEIFQEVNNAK
jgi:2',3'-cyclic-nucleotide 2'-phosphodiesterase / phosphoenolpyruvate phosphatase